MQPAPGVAGIEEDRLAAVDERRQGARIGRVGDRRHHQHDQVGAAHGVGEIGRHQRDGHEPLLHAADLDPAALAQRRKALGAACMEAHLIAAPAEIGGGGAAAMSGAENRHRPDAHFQSLPSCQGPGIMGGSARLSIKARVWSCLSLTFSCG